MLILFLFIAISILAFLLLPFFALKGKGILVGLILFINIGISSFFALKSLLHFPSEYILKGNNIFGNIPLRIDALSGFFIVLFNFVFIITYFYGLLNFSRVKHKTSEITLHALSFLLLHFSLISICIIQNFLIFLFFWELMALSAFVLIIFEHEKIKVIKAGINYLIQSHICIVFLLIGFIWVNSKTGSFDFNQICSFSASHQAESLIIFLIIFIGFAIKAGFVPFHTWLPEAHPAAPAHISGLMSGIIIKIGIYGILRMIILFNTKFVFIGYFILTLSIISGLYGVILAIVQHNLKRLLAYHSIENIGIIGIGIGVGCIGMGQNNNFMVLLGFATALLHTLNHALFKSLLFFTAGNIYFSSHHVNIEKHGGLIKKMPHTAILFLISAIAICGIPPFNGFISELLLYKSLYSWLTQAISFESILVMFFILSLVIIGGLAIFCFTKAFGLLFLGNPRKDNNDEIKEVPTKFLIPLYVIAFFILFIGLFPNLIFKFIEKPLHLFFVNSDNAEILNLISVNNLFNSLNIYFLGFVCIVAVVILIRKLSSKNFDIQFKTTWGCGYNGDTSKCQYTASSFVKTYTSLFKPLFIYKSSKQKINNVLPNKIKYHTIFTDKIEKTFIDIPLRIYKIFMNRFLFLQNGKLQIYILYGILFITVLICVPLIYSKINQLIFFLKQL